MITTVCQIIAHAIYMYVYIYSFLMHINIYIYTYWYIYIYIDTCMVYMQTLDACFPIESDPSHQYHSWSCQVWCRPCHVWGEDPYGHALPEGVSKGQSRTVGLAWFVGWVKCIDHPLCMACINEFIFITTKGTIEIIMIAIVVTDIDCEKQYSVVLCQFLWIWNPPGLSEAF